MNPMYGNENSKFDQIYIFNLLRKKMDVIEIFLHFQQLVPFDAWFVFLFNQPLLRRP